MKKRTLKIGEIVHVVVDNKHIGKGEIVSINGQRKDYHFASDELNVNVEITLTDVGIGNYDDRVGDNVNFANQYVYQIVKGKKYNGYDVCYSTDENYSYAFPYFCPETNDCFAEKYFDNEETQTEETHYDGRKYIKEQIESGRWDFKSDRFDITQALIDAWTAGYNHCAGVVIDAVNSI